jgi:hypothetical protein
MGVALEAMVFRQEGLLDRVLTVPFLRLTAIETICM